VYLRDLFIGLVRRWYILLLGFALTAGGAVYVARTVPVEYTAEASMVLLPPEAQVADDGNPYLQLGGLNQALDILSQRMTSESTRSDFRSSYAGASYTAGADSTTSGPILVIDTSSRRGETSLDMLGDLQQNARETLDAMQEELSIPDRSRIRITDVTTDRHATVDAKTRTQATLGVIGGGIVLTIVIAAIADRLLTARRARRLAARAAAKRAEAEAQRKAAAEAEAEAEASATDETDPADAADETAPDETAPDEDAADETAPDDSDETDSESERPAADRATTGAE
jgi:uncharacterized protein involved in exopolysaccharide biosynthesis